MVTNVMSFGRSGLADFVIQRATAVILALYTLCLVGFFLANPDVTYLELRDYFGNPAMQVFSTMALLSTAAHAWIGMWTIGTDYIRPHYFGGGATTYRFIYEAGCLFVLFLYVLWGLQIFWSL